MYKWGYWNINNKELKTMYYLEISKELYRSLILSITSSTLARFTKWMLVVLLHFSMVLVLNRKRKRKEGIRQNYGLTSRNLMMMKLNLILERTRTNRYSILMTLMMVKTLSKISILVWSVTWNKKRNSKSNLDLDLLSFIII